MESSVTRKNSPNVYKSCPKIISLEKCQILTALQKLPKNVGDLGKLIVAKALKSCPKSNKSPNLVTLKATVHYLQPLLKNAFSLTSFGWNSFNQMPKYLSISVNIRCNKGTKSNSTSSCPAFKPSQQYLVTQLSFTETKVFVHCSITWWTVNEFGQTFYHLQWYYILLLSILVAGLSQFNLFEAKVTDF